MLRLEAQSSASAVSALPHRAASLPLSVLFSPHPDIHFPTLFSLSPSLFPPCPLSLLSPSLTPPPMIFKSPLKVETFYEDSGYSQTCDSPASAFSEELGSLPNLSYVHFMSLGVLWFLHYFSHVVFVLQ